MNIQLNGEPFEVRGPVSISGLLELLDIDPRRVAVEHNRLVIKRHAYPQTTIQQDDHIEIVNFVGGG